MPAPQNLTDVYVDELRDLWSANDQMQALVKDLISEAKDSRLKETLQKSVGHIAEHTATLKSLLEAAGGEANMSVAGPWKGWSVRHESILPRRQQATGF